MDGKASSLFIIIKAPPPILLFFLPEKYSVLLLTYILGAQLKYHVSFNSWEMVNLNWPIALILFFSFIGYSSSFIGQTLGFSFFGNGMDLDLDWTNFRGRGVFFFFLGERKGGRGAKGEGGKSTTYLTCFLRWNRMDWMDILVCFFFIYLIGWFDFDLI